MIESSVQYPMEFLHEASEGFEVWRIEHLAWGRSICTAIKLFLLLLLSVPVVRDCNRWSSERANWKLLYFAVFFLFFFTSENLCCFVYPDLQVLFIDLCFDTGTVLTFLLNGTSKLNLRLILQCSPHFGTFEKQTSKANWREKKFKWCVFVTASKTEKGHICFCMTKN